MEGTLGIRLEMTCFWFIMILCIMIYVGGWRGGTIHKCKKITHVGNVGHAVDAVNIGGGDPTQYAVKA